MRQQIRERDAQILRLQQELERLRAQQTPSSPPVQPIDSAAAPGSTRPAATYSEDEIATALESSLIRQGGAVLSAGVTEIEPELWYFYAEPTRGFRRDAFGTAVNLRRGFRSSLQADLYLPYVIRDDQNGLGSSSGVGDVRLGLTKQLVRDRDGSPALLVFGRWRLPTGDIDKSPPTGFGQHGLQLGATVTKRADPVLLFGSASYTANLGSADLRNSQRLDAGNVWGLRLGANLAATPETSFFWGASYDSARADRFNGERIDSTDRARGFLDLGATRVIGQGRFVNVGVSFGVTPAAPDISLSVSLPFRF